MALSPSNLNGFLGFVDNYGTDPGATPGTLITASGSANTKGSYTQILSALSFTAYGLFVRITNVGTSVSNRELLLDIAVDPAGGSSYTDLIPNLNGGNATDSILGFGLGFYFPVVIVAGSTVAARCQSSVGSTTARVQVRADFHATHLESWPIGSSVEVIGTITNSRGVTFTPGNAADGTAVSLGTLTRAACWLQLGYSISTSTMGAERTYIDLMVGDGSSKRTIARSMHVGTNNEQLGYCIPANLMGACSAGPWPAGTEVWVRGRCENAPDSGYNALAYAVSA